MKDIGVRPLFLRHDTEGVARTEPKPDKYGSFFTMFSRGPDGKEYQMSTARDRSKAFVTQGTETTQDDYENTRQ